MDVLKKIKSSTLLETLVATVLIVIIFIVSSLVINNLLLNSFNNNTSKVENRLCELEYAHQNQLITIPYSESFESWDITINETHESLNNQVLIEFKAQKEHSNKVIVKKRINE